VSGGHTILLLLKNLNTWKKLGETRDDAVGEAFDKVARMLNLPYPGGPALEKLALSLPKGRSASINFPRPMLYDKSYDFSFSGLKTSVLYYLRDTSSNLRLPAFAKAAAGKQNLCDIAASFQKAAIDVLAAKTIRAAKEFRAKSVLLSGGVAANKLLRRELRSAAKKNGLNFFVADAKYNTDNAVMIAAAGYMSHLRKKKYPLRANGALNI
jgi:N6-L-threonylcarbamoyladenine synthase